MDSRLEKIEAKLSFAEDLLDELNRTVYRQQRQIEQLQRELTTVREQMRASLPAETRNIEDEVPPTTEFAAALQSAYASGKDTTR